MNPPSLIKSKLFLKSFLNSKIVLFLTVFLAGLLLFFPTFSLSLYGDDWLVFWRYGNFYPEGYTPTIWDQLNHFLTRYGSQDILTSFLRFIFGFESSYYYLISFFFRMTAAFSLYPVTFYLTKKKLPAFYAMLFFAVTTIGLETTEYLAHIPSYISLTFFNIFLYYFLKSREQEKGWDKKNLLYAGLFFFSTFIMAPIRMTGLLPFIFLIEIFWLLQNLSSKVFKKFLLRLFFVILIFLFINLIGDPFFFPINQSSKKIYSDTFLINQTTDSLFIMIDGLKNGRSDFLFYPVISFGSMFLPSILLQNPSTQLSNQGLIRLILLVFSLFIIAALIITRSLDIKKNYSFKKILLPVALWSLFSAAVYLLNQTTFPGTNYFVLLLIGGYVSILGGFILYKNYSSPLILQGIFVSLSWAIAAFIVPWFWSPTFLLDTYHRYLIGSAVGISLFLAIILSLAKNEKQQKVILSLFLILLILHIWASNLHIKKLLTNHNQQVNDKIWAAMPYIPEVGKSTEPLVFYFVGDSTNEPILHDTVTFGFPYHMGLIYGTTDEDKNPLSMIEWKDIESAVLDGASFTPHKKGRVLPPVSPERVYAFRLEGQDTLVNITAETRKKLTDLLKDTK